MTEPLIFEIGSPGRSGYPLPDCDVPERDITDLLPAWSLRDTPPPLPEVSEPTVARHYTRLLQLNHSIDTGFYPLGSCTMKYNPKIHEVVAALPGFRSIHPLQPPATVQGALRLMFELQDLLSAITGMEAVSLQPAAGAHGEFTGLLMIKAFHRALGQARHNILPRTRLMVPIRPAPPLPVTTSSPSRPTLEAAWTRRHCVASSTRTQPHSC